MINVIKHQDNIYPAFQAEGFAAKFVIPFAREVCVGYGVDCGCNRKEWAFVDRNNIPALTIDPAISPDYDALKLPPGKFDYIFSSHMLEHVPNWVDVIDYWHTKLKVSGTLFLYLPHPSQTYWRPWHNRKHIHSLHPDVIRQYLVDRGWKNIFVTGADLNNSFIAMAEKI